MKEKISQLRRYRRQLRHAWLTADHTHSHIVIESMEWLGAGCLPKGKILQTASLGTMQSKPFSEVRTTLELPSVTD
jgi:hypothetical protein